MSKIENLGALGASRAGTTTRSATPGLKATTQSVVPTSARLRSTECEPLEVNSVDPEPGDATNGDSPTTTRSLPMDTTVTKS